ncbi:MAG: hypothetical protein AAFR81_26670 [Chloroflexota bacterium]
MSSLTVVEQGLNKQLSIRPIANAHIEIEMMDYHGFGSGYTTLIPPTQLDLAQFLYEWVRFFESIFDLMIRDCLITSQDESLQVYREKLRALV